jgi:hypothetical protein
VCATPTPPWPCRASVHPKVVSERLGHASIGITLDTYSHVMPGMQEEAAETIDAGLRKALAGQGDGRRQSGGEREVVEAVMAR